MNPTPLNYCLNAIEDLQKTVETKFSYANDPFIYLERKHNLDYMAGFFTLLTELLHDAVKFTLPDNGRLMDTSSEMATITSKQLDLLLLPFPLIALEYSAPKLNDRLAEGNDVADKRISLALDFDKIQDKYKIEMQRLMPSISFEANAGQIAVFSVFHTKDGWESSLGCGFIDSNSSFENLIDHNSKKYIRVGTLVTPLNVLSPDPDEYLRLASDIGSDIADEAIALVEFCAIMNCSNVETQIIKAPAKLNQKRAITGKLPFHDYHVLVLSQADGKSYDNNNGGSHASPRLHLRRGHIRRLSDTRVTWVNAAIVGNKKNGIVEKSYLIDPT